MAVFDTPSTGQDNLQLPLSRMEELRQRVIAIQGFAVTGRDGHGGVERRVDCTRGHPERSIGVSCQHPIARQPGTPKESPRAQRTMRFCSVAGNLTPASRR